MLFFSFLDMNSNLQVTKVKMMENFRISKVSDLMSNQSVSDLTTRLFTIRGNRCDSALISDLFKRACPESEELVDQSSED
jgi:hypothetical protein